MLHNIVTHRGNAMTIQPNNPPIDTQLRIARGVDALAELGELLTQIEGNRTVTDGQYAVIARAVYRGQAMCMALNKAMQELRRELDAGNWLEDIGGRNES